RRATIITVCDGACYRASSLNEGAAAARTERYPLFEWKGPNSSWPANVNTMSRVSSSGGFSMMPTARPSELGFTDETRSPGLSEYEMWASPIGSIPGNRSTVYLHWM